MLENLRPSRIRSSMSRLRKLFRQAMLTWEGRYHLRCAISLDRARSRSEYDFERRILRLAAELCYTRGHLCLFRAAGIWP